MNGRLWEDLKDRKVLFFDPLKKVVSVLDGQNVIDLDLYVSANGHLMARKQQPAPIDQLAEQVPIPRHIGIDQIDNLP
jgi:hypothetical protein